MRKFRSLFLFLSVLFLYGFWGCSPKTSLKHDLDKEKTEPETTQIIYRIPSPIEIVNLLKISKLEYFEQVLNPMGNWENYTDLHSQSINLGVYSADLAYTAAYEQFQQSALYFSLIKKLGEKVGISSLFSESMSARVQNNLTNSDSLRVISNLYYRSMVDYLAENEKITELSMVYTGGWVETMYILTNTINTSQRRDILIQEIADQKLIVENLKQLLRLSIKNKDIKSTYNDLQAIFTLYDQLKISDQKPLLITDYKSGEIVIKGGISYSIDENEVDKLKKEITDIRNKWIKL